MTTVDYRLFINRDLPLRERGCESKALYLSRGEARSQVRNGRRGNAGLHPYRCRYCPHWHLGHRRRRHSRPDPYRNGIRHRLASNP